MSFAVVPNTFRDSRTSLPDTPSSSAFASPPLSTVHAPFPRGNSDGVDKCLVLPPACTGAECTLTFCGPPFSSLHFPTSAHATDTFSSTIHSYTSGTSGYATATASSPGYTATSLGSVETSRPDESSGTDVANSLTALQIVGISIGSVLGAILLVVFFWLLRRGTFGSGTLCGFRYGHARHPGWRPDGGLGQAEMREGRRRKGGALVTPFEPLNSTSTSLPSYPSSTLDAQPFLPGSKLHATPSLSSGSHGADSLAPPRSATAWSTSPSAFENAYGSIAAAYPSTVASGSVIGSGSRSAPSDALSMLEVSTVVSGSTGRSFPSLAVSGASYTPPPPSHPQPRWDNLMSNSPVREHSPAPTVSTASTGGASAISTIEGVRISSWHTSDSEETELIVRGPPRR